MISGKTSIEFEEHSGNILGELGDSGRLHTRRQIGTHLVKILKDRKLRDKQLRRRQIADILGIAPCEASLLMCGHFSVFTSERLLGFLRRLNKKVIIEISYHHEGEPYQEVILLR